MQRLMILSLATLVLSLLSGCGNGPAGSEQAAQSYFDSEFQKWIAGKDSEVSTMAYRLGLQPPIGYDIRSITGDDPDPLAFDHSYELPENWREWPSYKLNVAIEWKSEAGSPLTRVTTYRLTWNSQEAKWYVAERF